MDTKTMPNSKMTKQEIKVRDQDIFKNYSPALRNREVFCKKYGISPQRLNDIYWREAAKRGIERPNRIVHPETIRFTAPEGTNEELKQIAHEMRIDRPELLRRIVSDYIEKEKIK